jgi:hypothetical protein
MFKHLLSKVQRTKIKEEIAKGIMRDHFQGLRKDARVW